MNKIACIALLIAVSAQAQNAPAPKENAAPQSEKAPQNPAEPQAGGIVERELPSEEIRNILDMGYNFDVRKLNTKKVFPASCAIPLMPVPIPDKNFTIKNSPANTAIDPKVVSAPLVPACAPTVTPLVIKPLEPAAADKK